MLHDLMYMWIISSTHCGSRLHLPFSAMLLGLWHTRLTLKSQYLQRLIDQVISAVSRLPQKMPFNYKDVQVWSSPAWKVISSQLWSEIDGREANWGIVSCHCETVHTASEYWLWEVLLCSGVVTFQVLKGKSWKRNHTKWVITLIF